MEEKKCCCGAANSEQNEEAAGGTAAANSEQNEDMTETVAAEKKCCCGTRTKERGEKEYKDLMNRLKRIEGQVRGVEKMLENDAYCPDILVQVSAINSALNSFSRVLMANHIRSCVVNDLREGNEETIDELVRTMQKIMK